MPASWLSWRRSLACKTQPGEVHDPQLVHEVHSRAKVEAAVFVSRKVYLRSGCSRSIANLRDVIHSSRRIDGARVPPMANFSPKSVESNDFVQSIPHETLLHEQGCDNHTRYKHGQQASLHGKLVSLDDIVASHHPHPHHRQHRNDPIESVAATSLTSGSFYGTPLHPSVRANVQPDTPLHPSAEVSSKGSRSFKKLSGCYDCKNPTVSLVVYKTSSVGASVADTRNGNGAPGVQGLAPHPVAVPKAVCQRCGEAFFKYEALEQHHVLKHAVAELEVGDSSRNVVEIIFRTSWLRSTAETSTLASTSVHGSGGGVQQPKIVRVLKVNNLARTLARFEDYREGVKMRASKLPKKHPRCLADGNELLRFYSARLECELHAQQPVARGAEGNAEVTANTPIAAACASATCAICKIIRKGFPKGRGGAEGNKGILTTATSGRAHQLLMDDYGRDMGGSDSARYMTTDPEIARSSSVGGICSKHAAAARIDYDGADDGGGRSSRRRDHELGLGRRASGCDSQPSGRLMAMLVCRVIAGRVLKPQQQQSASASASATAAATPSHSSHPGPPPAGAGFDSVAGGELDFPSTTPADTPLHMGLHSRFEELTVFNPRAILPCFVVLYRY